MQTAVLLLRVRPYDGGITGSTRSSRHPTGRRFAQLVLTVLAGILGARLKSID